MNHPKPRSLRRLVGLRNYGLVLFVAWTLIIAYSISWGYKQAGEEEEMLAKMQGKTFFEKDLLFRRWAASHNGVYVPVTERTPPNPYLADMPERDLTTPSGKHLTLMNPAYMTRQLYEMAEGMQENFRGHITSRKPIRPENAADQWEGEVLKAFDQGVVEENTFQMINGKLNYRYMGRLMVEKNCLKCHASQGYQVGDVRGGISVSVLMDPIHAIVSQKFHAVLFSHLFIWVLGLGFIAFGTRRLEMVTASVVEGEQKYRAFFEQAAVGVAQTDAATGKFLKTNQRYCDIVGFTQEELDEMTFSQTLPADKQNWFRENTTALIEGRTKEISTQEGFLHKNGHTVWGDLTISPMWEAGSNADFFISVVQDITERRNLEENFRQSLKMESIGRLAGGVAHDFNNKLMVILGYAEMCLNDAVEGGNLRKNIDEIVKAAEHSRDITQQLLAFSRRQMVSPKPLNLNEAIHDIQKALSRLIGEDILLTFQLGNDLWPARIDPTQMDQIIMNLSLNARDAMPRGGELKISTRNVSFDETDCQAHPDVKPGEFVELDFIDTGHGMDVETKMRLFEPFFTTKDVGKGTGLGLATTYGIVTQNHGFITVFSEPGKGATFRIFLPRLVEVPMPELPPLAVEERLSGTILVVEDDESVRDMVTSMLERIGFAVCGCSDPKEAIVLCKDRNIPLDVILSDVVMPGLSGPEMVEEIKRTRPEIRVAYMSGYASEVITQKGLLDGSSILIPKPFDIQTLRTKMKEALA